jgi:hypothetical protein
VDREVTPRAVLIGLAFEGPELLAQTFADLREQGERLGMRFLEVARPVLHSRLGAPVVQRFERVREQLETQVRSLAEVGHIEEVRSRVHAQRGVRRAVDGLFDRLAGAPLVPEFVVAQGATFAGGLMDAWQGRTEPVPAPVVFPTRPVPAHM